jgi:hypothetical protein
MGYGVASKHVTLRFALVTRSAFAVRLPPTFDFVVTRRRDR